MSTLKRVLALSMALVMALSVGVFAADFTDADDISAACTESIDMLKALNVLDGFTDGSFRPNGTLNRGQVAKMMYVLLTGETNADAFKGLGYFTDVTGHWAEGFVNYCASNNILAGRGNGIFDPEAPVKGTELSKMLLVAAGYGLDKANYTGANWDSNVILDARKYGLTAGYGVAMGEAAPRQWAAYLFGNLITKVEMAEYLFGEVVNGTKLGSENAPTFGQSEMNLYVFEGLLNEVPGISIANGNGIDDDVKTSQVKVNNAAGLPTTNQSFKFTAKTSLLGQSVKVYSKVKDASKSGPALFGSSNMTILAIVAGPNNAVVETTVGDISYDSGKLEIDGFDEQALNGVIFDNAYDSSTLVASDLDKNGNDKVTVVDYDADGNIDYIFVQQITYTKITSVNNLRVLAEGGFNMKTDEINYVDGKAAKNDIVAITENYESGELVYDIRVLQPETTGKPTKWTTSGSKVASVTISGTKYTVATDALDVDNTHTIFYFDGDYVVKSAKELDKEETGLPTNLAIVTGISVAGGNTKAPQEITNSLGVITGYGFKTQYMGLDGKTSATKTYEYEKTDDAVGGATISDFGKDATGGTKTVYDAVGALQIFTSNFNGVPAAPQFVTVTENSDGTVYYEYVGTSVSNVSAEYSKSKGTLIAGNKYYIEDNTQVFFANKSGKFSLSKGKDLNSFATGDGYKLLAVYTGTQGEALAIYLHNNAETSLPGDTTTFYGALTGKNSNWSKSTGLNGKDTYNTNAAIDANGDAFDLVIEESAAKPAQYSVFKYTTGTKCHTVTPVAFNVFGSVAEVNDDEGYIVFNVGASTTNPVYTRYYYDANTVIFDVGSKHASVAEVPFESLDGLLSAAMITDSNGDIELLVINSDGKPVAPKLPGSANLTVDGGTTAVTTAAVGKTLTPKFTDVPANATKAYAWFVGDASTPAATTATFDVLAEHFGKTITLVVKDSVNNYSGTIEAEVEVTSGAFSATLADVFTISGLGTNGKIELLDMAAYFGVDASKITTKWYLGTDELATGAGTGVAGTTFILAGNTVTIPAETDSSTNAAKNIDIGVVGSSAATITAGKIIKVVITVDGTEYTASFTVGLITA